MDSKKNDVPKWGTKKIIWCSILGLFVLIGIVLFVAKGGWWRWERWPESHEWQAFWGAAAAVAGLVAAVGAVAAAFGAWGQFRSYLRQEIDTRRPYVFVDFSFTSNLAYLEVTNNGLTTARNITFETSREIMTSNAESAKKINEYLINATIPQLGPAKKLRYFFDRGPNYIEADLPMQYTITVKYFGSSSDEELSETFVLDLDQWANVSQGSDYDNLNLNMSKRNEVKLHGILTELKKFNQSFSKLLDASDRPKSFEDIFGSDSGAENHEKTGEEPDEEPPMPGPGRVE